MVKLAQDGKLKLTIEKREASLFCEAKASVQVLVECARCLKPFEHPLNVEFSFIAKSGQTGQDNDFDNNIIFFSRTDNELDITDIVSEELSINLPMKPVCHKDCKGLCPSCGVNLNKEDCNCLTPSHNPAWDALLKLKENQ